MHASSDLSTHFQRIWSIYSSSCEFYRYIMEHFFSSQLHDGQYVFIIFEYLFSHSANKLSSQNPNDSTHKKKQPAYNEEASIPRALKPYPKMMNEI